MIEITPEMTVAELLEQSNLNMDILQSWVEMLETPPPKVVDTRGVEVLEGGREGGEGRSAPILELIPGGKISGVANALQKKYGKLI